MLLDKEKMKHREEKRTRKRNQDRAILYDLAKVQTKKETTLKQCQHVKHEQAVVFSTPGSPGYRMTCQAIYLANQSTGETVVLNAGRSAYGNT